MQKKLLLLPLLLFGCMGFFLWKALFLNNQMIPSPLINKPAPTFHLPNLFDLSEKISHEDFVGHVTLLNVWATWCFACKQEHSLLVNLANRENITIYGLNYKDDSRTAKDWLLQEGNPYQMVAFDKKGETAIDFGVYGTPETFIIDKKGVIRYKHIGPITEVIWKKKLEPLVAQLNNEIL